MQKCILVVDDDEMNLKRTKRILEKEYDVLLARSGLEALDKLKGERADMILLDIAMPEMDGLETFKRMKGLAIDIPVIFLTASGDEDDVLNAIMLGAVNYLKKPFTPQELLRRIAMGLEKNEREKSDKHPPSSGLHSHYVWHHADPAHPVHVLGTLDGSDHRGGQFPGMVFPYRKGGVRELL